MDKSRLKNILLIVFIFGTIFLFTDNLDLRREMKKETERVYAELLSETSLLVRKTQRVNLEEVMQTEYGEMIVGGIREEYVDLNSEYFSLANNEVRKLADILIGVADLEETLISKGKWTKEEKEAHSGALRALQLIMLDFNDFSESNGSWEELFTNGDSPLIERINFRIESEGVEL